MNMKSPVQMSKNHSFRNFVFGCLLLYIFSLIIDDWECFKQGLKGSLPNHSSHSQAFK